MYLVIGELLKDVFIEGDVKRISPEAPIPVFNPTSVKYNLGGAGNVCENLSAFCDKPEIVFLHQKNVITKTRYVSLGQHLLRVDENDKAEDSISIYDVTDKFNLKQFKAIIVSDYNKGFVNENFIYEISSLAKMNQIPMFLDTKKILTDWATNVEFIKINDPEYRLNSGNSNFNPFNLRNLIVTNGGNPCTLYTSEDTTNRIKEFGVDNVEVVDTVGCGDTMLACLAGLYVKNRDLNKSIVSALKLASLAATKRGVYVVTKEDITKCLG